MLHLYDGRNLIGTINDFDGAFDAFDVTGRHLGTFKKCKAAVAAVNAAAPPACDASARRDNSA